MRAWHTKPVNQGGRGWADVGYHFFIAKDGTVQPGRPLEAVPAAQIGYNKGAIAICLHGLSESRFTSQQIQALVMMCGAMRDACGPSLRFRGHCEVAAKACPVINYRSILNLDSRGYMGGGGATAINTDNRELTEDLIAAPDALDLMDRGARVKILQEQLNQHGYGLSTDGIFGMRTRDAVIKFQKSRELVPDGIVGPATWSALQV
jgi:N-acetyl-anhydromuramyl-L-alanine amidase AmpD